jgi:hypothetical protein
LGLAPIALFVYKRADHTLRTLEALAECDHAQDSCLTIFSDGPKKPEDEPMVAAVREVIRSRTWCGEVEIVERESNRGLANSVMAGVTRLCKEHDRVIVLEDDLVVSTHFLDYMNTALDRYADEPRVMQISGYMFDAELNIQPDAFFMPFTTSWGWATWKRAWDHLDPDMRAWGKIAADPRLKRRFDLDGTYENSTIADLQTKGLLDSWAVRWYLSVFDMGGLTLYPTQSMVLNIGMDGSGTHCGKHPDAKNFSRNASVQRYPKTVDLSNDYSPVLRYLKRNTMRSRFRRYAVRTVRGLKDMLRMKKARP